MDILGGRRYDGAAMEQEEEVVERELREMTDALVREYRPEKIILFGSRAWGIPGPTSDVDLCVLKEHDKDPLDALHEAYRIVGGCSSVGVDVVLYTPRRFEERAQMGDPFVRRIRTRGRILYDAQRR